MLVDKVSIRAILNLTCYCMDLYFSNDEDLKLSSITNIPLLVIFYMNKNRNKIWSI
jgi:hypothetical protein